MKEAYYFSHDSNADADPKMATMMCDYKATGYGWYFIILSVMREQNNYKIKIDKNIFRYLARRCYTSTKKIEKFVTDCIDTYELFQQNENFLFSSSFLERMELKEKKSKSYSERGKKGMASRYGYDNTAITNSNKESKVKESKVKESKVKENKEKENKQNTDIFCNPDFQKSFTLYSEHCKNLLPILFEKRNRDVLNLLSDVLSEIDYDFEQFKELCIKANNLEKIVNSKIDFKTMLKNYIGILSGKYENNVIDTSKIDFS